MFKKKEVIQENPNEPLYMKVKEQIFEVIDNNEITVMELEEIIFPDLLKIIKNIAIVPYKKRMSRAQRLSKIVNKN